MAFFMKKGGDLKLFWQEPTDLDLKNSIQINQIIIKKGFQYKMVDQQQF